MEGREHRLNGANAVTDNPGKITLLEDQVKSLSIQNAELKKRNEILVASGSSSVPYQQLVSDYHQLTILYRTARSEIEHLRQVIKIGSDFRRHYETASQPNVPRTPDVQLLQERPTPISLSLRPGYVPIQVSSNLPIPPKVHPLTTGPHYAPHYSQRALQQSHPSVNHSGHSGIVPRTGSLRTVEGPPPQQKLATSIHQKIIDPSPLAARSTSNPHRCSPPDNKTSTTTSSEIKDPLSTRQPDDRSSLYGLPHIQQSTVGSLYPLNTMQYVQPIPGPTPEPATWSPLQAAVSPLSPASREPSATKYPRKSIEIATPTCGVTERLAVKLTSSPVLGIEHLKRVREEPSDDSDDHLGLKKKTRLEDSPITLLVRPDGDTKSAEDEEENRVSRLVKLEEEESEQEIEVDSDGLRSVASCVSEVMQTSAEDPEVQTCRLCELRHKNEYISEPGKAFLRGTQEDLVRHLTDEHADAWETLRRDV
ncbi:hypothetical protein AX15_002304 [Amanita polypyramis BW_CC]|nr:hypothetical protein AX15_002304 [Amanita polypyramis BW_CC]